MMRRQIEQARVLLPFILHLTLGLAASPPPPPPPPASAAQTPAARPPNRSGSDGVATRPVRVRDKLCPKAGDYTRYYPGDCNKYYICNNGQASEQSCPWFYKYDSKSNRCKLDMFPFSSVHCSSADNPTQRDEEDEWSLGLYEWIDGIKVMGVDPTAYKPFIISQEPPTVEFMLYTRDNPDDFTPISVDDPESLEKLDQSKDLKILTHGWRNDFESKFGTLLKDAYLEAVDVNVIVVDWSSKSYKNYISSRMAVPKVAEAVAELVDELVKLGYSLDNIHLVGHSLGAHVSGIAGLRLKLKSGLVGRVTGLDPAGPMFNKDDEDVLKQDSAKFVDVIHTCAYMLGFVGSIGHVDFYPNKGTISQPGCGYDYKGTCSHSRAYKFFAESIASGGMLAVKCHDSDDFDDRNCTSQPPIPMGEQTPHSARGSYYLRTNKDTPYARGNTY